MKINETSEKNKFYSIMENAEFEEKINDFPKAKIGFDKIYRSSKNISSHSKKNEHENNFENNIAYTYCDSNSYLNEEKLKLEENFQTLQIDDVHRDTISYEEIFFKNSKNLHKYKTEGCLVIYDDKLEVQKNYKIDFASLLNTLSFDPSSTENFIDGSKGRWVEVLEKGIDSELNGVEFESRFESGNLRMAIKVDSYEYDLILHNDINSEKTSNWFYFEIKLWASKYLTKINLEDNISDNSHKIKLNIINLQKKNSLFSKGLRVLKYSYQSNKWSRDTNDVYYYPNGIYMNDKSLYTLSFTFNVFENNEKSPKQNDSGIDEHTQNDEVDCSKTFSFSYCFPYTYTDLNNYLESISSKENLEKLLKIETIGKSLCNNSLYMLSISNFESSLTEIAARPAIVLTARVHPGESNSSLVIQGVIDFLLVEDNPIAKELRSKFIFQIVPMLNPDGIINGNYRSCVNGKDLNRMWVDPRETLCPTLFYTKQMVKNILARRKVYLFCDFHGHSNKNNFFIFGCPIAGVNGVKTEDELILPDILSTLNDSFDATSCVYKLSKSKIKTARAVMKNEFDIKFSYCMESSVGGITIGERKNKFFTPEDYFEIGKDFCLALNEMEKKEKLCGIENKINLKTEIELKKSKSVDIEKKIIKKKKIKPMTSVKTEENEKIKISINNKENNNSKMCKIEKNISDRTIKLPKYEGTNLNKK